MVQYTYNGSENKKTKMMLFFANYRYNPKIQEPNTSDLLLLVATENMKRLSSLHIQLVKDTEFINKSIDRYYDKRHIDVLSWKEGDKVYLHRKNI